MGKIFKDIDKLASTLQALKSQGKRIGWVTGAFDIIHIGHIRFIKWAKEHCQILVIGANSDGLVKMNKGRDRPFFNQGVRAEVLSALGDVDFILLTDNPDLSLHSKEAISNLEETVQKLKPDIIIASKETDASYSYKEESAKRLGIKFEGCPLPRPSSTSLLAKKLIEEI